MASKVPIKTAQELETMHTGTLMNRRKALLKCEETSAHSDQTRSTPSNDTIEFKDTPQWQTAYADVKTVLATRENMPNKAERKAMRQAKAKSGK